MLVHDDLIDGSVIRRNRPTLHEAIRLDADRPDDPLERKRACDLGLIAGDLLFALGMRLLGRSGLDDAALGRANRLVADMLFETGLGEALDVLYDDCPLEHLSEEQLVESYLRKTARYSVSGPLVLGATIAGAPPQVARALDRFGDLLGFGFQVQNDLDALDEDPEYGDHPDLDGGKRTYVLWAAYQRPGERGRRALDEALGRPVGLDRRRTAPRPDRRQRGRRSLPGPARRRSAARPSTSSASRPLDARPAPPVRRPDRDVPSHEARRPGVRRHPDRGRGVAVPDGGMVDA